MNSNISSLSLLTKSGSALKGKFAKAFLGTFVYLTPLVLLSLIPYAGLVLAVLLFGYLTSGYITYMKKLINGEEIHLKMIFDNRKNIATKTFLGALLFMLVAIGSALLIVPGVIVLAYYSMSLFVLEEENSTSIMETFRRSAELAKGHKLNIVSYKVLFYILVIILGIGFAILALLVDKLFVTLPILAVALFIVLALLALITLTILVMYYAGCNQVYYSQIIKKN